jgi:hypothetical protein
MTPDEQREVRAAMADTPFSAARDVPVPHDTVSATDVVAFLRGLADVLREHLEVHEALVEENHGMRQDRVAARRALGIE